MQYKAFDHKNTIIGPKFSVLKHQEEFDFLFDVLLSFCIPSVTVQMKVMLNRENKYVWGLIV